MEKAIFAAGCFWGVQYYFDQVPGVKNTVVGYTGGHVQGPTYEQVCTHTTGHAEAVLVEFDPSIVSYRTLVKHFFRIHNPTQLDRQGPDVGDNYRSEIYYVNESQKQIAEEEKAIAQSEWEDEIVTLIEPQAPFYDAEDYHQKYAERTGRGMCHVPYAPVKGGS